jgi:hypothetical protein
MNPPQLSNQNSGSSGESIQLRLNSLLHLRVLVLALGQNASAGWWPCSFFTTSSSRFLATPFPRSAFWAAIHASTLAAARHHDDRIGTGGTVHLFRLGPEIEIKLRDKVLRDGWRPAFEPTSTREVLLGHLKKTAQMPAKAPPAGPVRVSDRNRFTSSNVLEQVAGIFLSAIESGIQILPYGADK